MLCIIKSTCLYLSSSLNYFVRPLIHLSAGLRMCWIELVEEELMAEDEVPEAQDIQDPMMDLTRGERGNLRDTVAVTERT